ncbi:MAG TPA: hypothetical protein VKE74_11410 [Gemmataceae bacterium]|nr:hypothetical protein [Gemmataceae bacterium]
MPDRPTTPPLTRGEARPVRRRTRAFRPNYCRSPGHASATTNARNTAMWKGGLDELRQFGLVEPLGSKEEVFEVTREGWLVYEQLMTAK